MDISISGPKFMQPIRLAQAETAYLFHQLKQTQVLVNMKLTLQGLLKTQC